MPRLTALYVDFEDPDCRRAWRWLSLLPEREGVEVRPFWRGSRGAGPSSPWEPGTPTWGLELLALGECARDAGRDVHCRFLDAVFASTGGAAARETGPETWLRLGTELGLDLDRYTSEGDRWRAEVGLWQREAADELGVAGVPTLVFDDRHALRLVLAEDVGDTAAALRLLATLGDLAAQPVTEVHRTR